jgi:hypothetical protein
MIVNFLELMIQVITSSAVYILFLVAPFPTYFSSHEKYSRYQSLEFCGFKIQ